jgi:hypothetical protein
VSSKKEVKLEALKRALTVLNGDAPTSKPSEVKAGSCSKCGQPCSHCAGEDTDETTDDTTEENDE